MILRLPDRPFQLGYLWAHRARRIWWRLTGRSSDGALVALWSENQVLIIRESYREQWSLPGGGIRVGEKPIAAAIREVEEEVGVTLASDALRYLSEFERTFQNVAHRVHVFETRIAPRPRVHIDNREIIRAEWCTREAALEMNLVPLLRMYLEGQIKPLSDSPGSDRSPTRAASYWSCRKPPVVIRRFVAVVKPASSVTGPARRRASALRALLGKHAAARLEPRLSCRFGADFLGSFLFSNRTPAPPRQ